jgi:hypothetical protein
MKRRIRHLVLASIALLALSTAIAFAHPGPTDPRGCHPGPDGRIHCH